MRLLTTVVLSLLLASTGFSEELFNFDDGTNGGLNEYSALEPFGLGASFTAAGGTYRISGPGNTVDEQLSVNRASAFSSTIYSDFRVSVDVVDWDTSLVDGQGIDLFARGQEIGLGTSDGYGFVFQPAEGIRIFRADDEVPTFFSDPVPLDIDPLKNYHLVFTGSGPNLVGQIYDLADLNNPLEEVTATDSTYEQGVSGILATGPIQNPTIGFDSTFDNLTLSGQVVPEPSTVSLFALGALGLLGLCRRRVSA